MAQSISSHKTKNQSKEVEKQAESAGGSEPTTMEPNTAAAVQAMQEPAASSTAPSSVTAPEEKSHEPAETKKEKLDKAEPDKKSKKEKKDKKDKKDKKVKKDKKEAEAKAKQKANVAPGEKNEKNEAFKLKLAEKIKETQMAHILIEGGQPHPTEQSQEQITQDEVKIKKEPVEPQVEAASSSKSSGSKQKGIEAEVEGAGEVEGHGKESASSTTLVVPPGTANMAPDDPCDFSGIDLTSHFGPGGKNKTKDPLEPGGQELFKEADLVVPGIALKKMKQAMSQASEGDMNSYIALLGLGSVKAYRVERPTVHKMILGNMNKYGEEFWKRATQHLGDLSAALIMTSKEAEQSFIKEVTLLFIVVL